MRNEIDNRSGKYRYWYRYWNSILTSLMTSEEQNLFQSQEKLQSTTSSKLKKCKISSFFIRSSGGSFLLDLFHLLKTITLKPLQGWVQDFIPHSHNCRLAHRRWYAVCLLSSEVLLVSLTGTW